MEANHERGPRAVGRDRQPVSPAQPLPNPRRTPSPSLLLSRSSCPGLPWGRRSSHDFAPRALLPTGRRRRCRHSTATTATPSAPTTATTEAAATPLPSVFQPTCQHASHALVLDSLCNNDNYPCCSSFTLWLCLSSVYEEDTSPHNAHQTHSSYRHPSPLKIIIFCV